MVDKIAVFIHVYPVGHYREIIEKFRTRNEGLFKEAVTVIVSVNGNVDWASSKTLGVDFPVVVKNENDFEFPTLDLIKLYCGGLKEQHKILYLHTKGVSYERNECIDDWVDYMTYFCLERWHYCSTALNMFDTCGVDLVKQPALHYSGNFWWAKSDYIKKLKRPREIETVLDERHKAEFWICSEEGKHLCLHNSNIPVFERDKHRYDESNYIKFE